MQLDYVLVVNGPIYGQQSALTAYRFALALLEKGHRLSRVFFYQAGVTNANALVVPASDEFDLHQAWQTLASQHQIALETCVSASLRRGVVGDDEASVHQLASKNLGQGFSQAGLGSLAESLLTADRVIQF